MTIEKYFNNKHQILQNVYLERITAVAAVKQINELIDKVVDSPIALTKITENYVNSYIADMKRIHKMYVEQEVEEYDGYYE